MRFPRVKGFQSLILSRYVWYSRCKVAFYSNDSHLSNRKTSFGYGKKSDFTKDLTASPGSTKYTHKSSFDAGKNKGITFGLEREKLPDNSYLIPQLSKFPGPGQVNFILPSMKIKSKLEWAKVIRWEPKPSILFNRKWVINNPQAQEHINTSSCNLKQEDLRYQNSQT